MNLHIKKLILSTLRTRFPFLLYPYNFFFAADANANVSELYSMTLCLLEITFFSKFFIRKSKVQYPLLPQEGRLDQNFAFLERSTSELTAAADVLAYALGVNIDRKTRVTLIKLKAGRSMMNISSGLKNI